MLKAGNRMRLGSPVSCVCAAVAIAIGASQTAWADYWDWVGKGAGETSYFDEHGNAKGISGSWHHSVDTGSEEPDLGYGDCRQDGRLPEMVEDGWR